MDKGEQLFGFDRTVQYQGLYPFVKQQLGKFFKAVERVVVYENMPSVYGIHHAF